MGEEVLVTYDSIADKQSLEAKRNRMEVYVEWLLTPKSERFPSTKTELAKQLGVSLQTLGTYSRDRWLQDEYLRRARAVFKADRMQQVLDSLYHQAIDVKNQRSVQAAGKLMQWAMDTVERDRDEALDLERMSPEDLMDLAVALAKKANKVDD